MQPTIPSNNMIRQGIKNYFYSLRYFFTSLGVLAFALVWGLSIAIPGISGCVRGLIGQIGSTAAEWQIDFPSLMECLEQKTSALDWNRPNEALEALLSPEWMTDTINACLNAVGVDGEAVALQLSSAILEAVLNIFLYVVLVAVFLFIGLFAGTVITKMLIRNAIAKRSLKKTLLVLLVDAPLSAALVFLLSYLVLFGSIGILLAALLAFLLFGLISLLEAYIVHAWKRVPMKAIVNLRNIGSLLLCDLLLVMLTAVLVILVSAISTPIIGSLFGMTLTQITLIVVGMNAESYVLKIVPEMSVPCLSPAAKKPAIK